MSFEFQSTLVNLTPEYRIAGEQIGGVRIFTTTDNVKVARVMITGDKDIQFAATGAPYETGVPNDIYVALQPHLAEILEDELLVNPSAISSIKHTSTEIIIQIEGDGRAWRFIPTTDSELLTAKVIADHTYELTAAGFTALSTAAATLRESVDGTLEGLNTAITTEINDRIAAITDEEQRVDALIASGMWLYADQAAFPAPGDNHGRIVHSHADASMFYAHAGAWHKIENEAEAEAARLVIQNDVDANETASDAAEAALSGRLDVLEVDPTTATAVAAGDAATLSSATTYTDTAITNVIGTAPGILDTLGEIADAINDDANVYTTLAASIAAVQTDVDGNETASDAADAALSGRIDTLEADPTTAAAVAAVQADVDANQTASESADTALSGRLDTLEADPTTATAVAAVQSDVDQNEVDSDAAIAAEATTRGNADTALSGRLDVLEADPTTATAVAAVQADVDQNESDADTALALKAPLADPDFTGILEVDTNARIEFADNLTKIHNVLRGTSINIGNNIEIKPAAAGGRVEITGDLLIDASDFVDAANDTAAAAAGVVVGQVYRNGSDLKVRVS